MDIRLPMADEDSMIKKNVCIPSYVGGYWSCKWYTNTKKPICAKDHHPLSLSRSAVNLRFTVLERQLNELARITVTQESITEYNGNSPLSLMSSGHFYAPKISTKYPKAGIFFTGFSQRQKARKCSRNSAMSTHKQASTKARWLRRRKR